MLSIIYQTIHFVLDKCNPLLTKYRKGILYNSEDETVSSFNLNT